ncbi:MAG: LacI family DNA-binding transcriptional regulator [Spirochaetes bacterium]|nr:LacI family DNA-binding transcriptional regulator [Spirochaetota bacterium]
MSAKDATIKDIASRAGVSYATVSRALNGKYGVKPSTRERVLGVARRLGYRPNVIARGLVTRRTMTIGLIVPDIKNPFFPEVAGGVEDAAREAGYGVLLCNSNWQKVSERQYVALLAGRRVEGIIMAPISSTEEPLDDRVPTSFPVVYVSNTPRTTARSYVVIDNARGGLLATKHLLDAGRTPVAFIGSRESSGDERFEGYRRALEDHGVAYDERFVRLGDMKQASGYRLFGQMIEDGDRPRAVFAENDLMALGCMQAARERGFRVPEDIAIIGFDDIPFASFPEVQLTTIRQPTYDMGRMAVDILLACVARSPGWREARQVVLKPQLVVRRTA